MRATIYDGKTWKACTVDDAQAAMQDTTLSWNDIRLTLDTYGGLFGDDLDALAQRMDEAASQGASTTNGSSMVPLRRAVDRRT